MTAPVFGLLDSSSEGVYQVHVSHGCCVGSSAAQRVCWHVTELHYCFNPGWARVHPKFNGRTPLFQKAVSYFNFVFFSPHLINLFFFFLATVQTCLRLLYKNKLFIQVVNGSAIVHQLIISLIIISKLLWSFLNLKLNWIIQVWLVCRSTQKKLTWSRTFLVNLSC